MNFYRSVATAAITATLFGSAIAINHRAWSHIKTAAFSIDFPESPQVVRSVRRGTTHGDLKVTDYALAIPGHVLYLVEDVNIASGFKPGESDGGALPSYMAVWAQANKCQVVSHSNMDIQGHPALVVMIKRGPLVGRSFAVQSGNHLVVVAAVSTPSEVNSDVLSQFLNSFKVG